MRAYKILYYLDGRTNYIITNHSNLLFFMRVMLSDHYFYQEKMKKKKIQMCTLLIKEFFADVQLLSVVLFVIVFTLAIFIFLLLMFVIQ